MRIHLYTQRARHSQDSLKMAELSNVASPSLSCYKELNCITQQVAWTMIRNKLYSNKRYEKNWHQVITVCCSVLSWENTLSDTSHLLTVLSLCCKLHSDEKNVALQIESIVRLLGRLVLFPELECCRDKLEALLEEAYCQVILQHYHDSGSEAALALIDEYFGPISHTDPNYSVLAHTLHDMLTGRRTGLDGFIAERTISRFRTEVLDVLNTVLSNLNSSAMYDGFCEYVSHLPQPEDEDYHVAEEFHSEEEGVEDKDEGEGEGEGEEDDGEVREDQKGDEGEEEEEDGEAREDQKGDEVASDNKEGREDDEMEEIAERGENAVEGTDQETEQEGSEHPLTKKMRRNPEGEEIEWEESSGASTPPSNLPSGRSISIRNRRSLVGATGRATLPLISISPTHGQAWTYAETENLLKGVKKFGIGKWKEILKNYEFSSHRTSVSLKDKWRNLKGRR